MEEQLISFEVAKLAKEKGFKEKCYATYYDYPSMYKEYSAKKLIERKLDKIELHFNNSEIWIHPSEKRNGFLGCDSPEHYIRYIDYKSHLKNNNISKKDSAQKHWYSAPTQTLLQKWLREKHNIFLTVEYSLDKDDWFYYLYKQRINKYIHFKTYEEAFEAGLKEALQLIK